jgi:hypothetical protein
MLPHPPPPNWEPPTGSPKLAPPTCADFFVGSGAFAFVLAWKAESVGLAPNAPHAEDSCFGGPCLTAQPDVVPGLPATWRGRLLVWRCGNDRTAEFAWTQTSGLCPVGESHPVCRIRVLFWCQRFRRRRRLGGNRGPFVSFANWRCRAAGVDLPFVGVALEDELADPSCEVESGGTPSLVTPAQVQVRQTEEPQAVALKADAIGRIRDRSRSRSALFPPNATCRGLALTPRSKFRPLQQRARVCAAAAGIVGGKLCVRFLPSLPFSFSSPPCHRPRRARPPWLEEIYCSIPVSILPLRSLSAVGLPR